MYIKEIMCANMNGVHLSQYTGTYIYLVGCGKGKVCTDYPNNYKLLTNEPDPEFTNLLFILEQRHSLSQFC
jgi:hypothetical protein